MKVLILGLGQYPHGSGVEAALFFAKKGDDVVVTDLKSAKELSVNVERLSRYKQVRFVLGEHRLEDVRWADMVVPNPRVRPDSPCFKEAVRLGKQIESDITIFLTHSKASVIGVTGTRGKSTTSALIAEMLKADGRRVWLGGNILVSPLAFLSKVKPRDWVVLELSSWQLELTGRTGVSPPYAVWTNLMRDHLNTYGSMKEYAEAKAQIFRHQKPDSVVLLPSNRSFNGYASSAPGEVVRVGSSNSEATKIVKATKLKIEGEHNQRNAEYAVALARRLGVKAAVIKRVLKTFPGLPNRQEEIAMIRGVRYINDTTSTTPDATIAALQALHQKSSPLRAGPRHRRWKIITAQSGTPPQAVENKKCLIHLIFGGADKELEFLEVSNTIKHIKPFVYLLPGTAHEKIVQTFRRAKIVWREAEDLREAMKQIQSNVGRGDMVLLSPGCASFGLFKHEFDRGAQFVKLVKKLKK